MSLIDNVRALLNSQHSSDAEVVSDSLSQPDKFTAAQGATIDDILSIFTEDCEDTKFKLARMLPIMQLLAEAEYDLAVDGSLDGFTDSSDLLSTFMYGNKSDVSVDLTDNTYAKFSWDVNMLMSGGDVTPIKVLLESSADDFIMRIMRYKSSTNSMTNIMSVVVDGSFSRYTTVDDALQYFFGAWDRTFDYYDASGFMAYTLVGTSVKFSQVFENLSNSFNLQNVMVLLNNSVAPGEASIADVLATLQDYRNSTSTNVQKVISIIKSFGSKIKAADVVSIDKSMASSLVNATVSSQQNSVTWDTSTYAVEGWNATTFFSTLSQIGTVLGTVLLAAGGVVGKIVGFALTAVSVGVNILTSVLANAGDTIGDIDFTARNRYFSQPYLTTLQYYPATSGQLTGRFSDFIENHPALHAKIIEKCDNAGWCVMYTPFIDFIFQKDKATNIYTVTGFLNLNYGVRWPENQNWRGQRGGTGWNNYSSFSYIKRYTGKWNASQSTDSNFLLLAMGSNITGADEQSIGAYAGGYTSTPRSEGVTEFMMKPSNNISYAGYNQVGGTSGGYKIMASVTPPERGLFGFNTTQADSALRARITKLWMMLTLMNINAAKPDWKGFGNVEKFYSCKNSYAFTMGSNQHQFVDGSNTISSAILSQNVSYLAEKAASAGDLDGFTPVCTWSEIVNYLMQSTKYGAIPVGADFDGTPTSINYVTILNCMANLFEDEVVISTPRYIPDKFFLGPAKSSVESLIGTIFTVIAVAAAAVTAIALGSFAIKRALQGRAAYLLGQAEQARENYMADPSKANLLAVRRAALKANWLCKLGGFGTYNWMQDWFETDSGYSQAGMLAMFTESEAGQALTNAVIADVAYETGLVRSANNAISAVDSKVVTANDGITSVNLKVVSALDHIDADLATTADVYSVVANIDDNLVAVNDNIISVAGNIVTIQSDVSGIVSDVEYIKGDGTIIPSVSLPDIKALIAG